MTRSHFFDVIFEISTRYAKKPLKVSALHCHTGCVAMNSPTLVHELAITTAYEKSLEVSPKLVDN